jgi:hypothetical protein
MSLKNDTFPIKRHWLSAAFGALAEMPDAFASARLGEARKRFLAGNNQLTAIRNWLVCGEVIDASGRRGVDFTDLGKLMSAQDPYAKSAVTWWLLHLHLCANSDAFPYATFFATFDVDGNWITVDDIVQRLLKTGGDDEDARSVNTVESYFAGVENAFQPGEMLFALGLIERRNISVEGSSKRALRRTSIIPPDILVLYATLLFQSRVFSNQATVTTLDLLKAGLAKALGMKDKEFREALSRIHHDKDYGGFIQYRKQVNLDSIQFLRQGDAALKPIRMAAYRSGQVQWI